MNSIISVKKICNGNINFYERILNDDEQMFIQNLMMNNWITNHGNKLKKK